MVSSLIHLVCCFMQFFLRPWSHRLRPKKLHASVAMSVAPVRVPSQRLIAPSVTSVVNGKGDNEMILEAVQRSPGKSFHYNQIS